MIAPKTEFYKIIEHVDQYKYIYVISVIGFFITGVLQYPYPLDWDSQYVFDTHVLGNMSPTSWMGWFYPYFWKFLYKMTNNINSMGIFIQIW